MKFNTRVEICEIADEEVAGRAKIKMSALKISKNDSDNNENGINWVEKYVNDNIKSMIGASYKVAFIDDDKTYPSGHGSLEYDEDGNVIFPDSDTVGSIQNAYIETVEIDGTQEKVLTTEGYIYKQSYPNFYNWLKTEATNNVIYGSVEINGKGKNRNIIYDGKSKNSDGTPMVGRKPKVFDFTALAILSDFVPPADKYSRVFEVNSKDNKSSQTIEINELSYDDIATLIVRAFNSIKQDEQYYYVYKLYPISGTVIMVQDNIVPRYFKTTYKLSNSQITLSEITEVEMDWKPVNNEQEVEVNTSFIKDILTRQNKGVKKMENDKLILELNQKLEDKTTEINNLTTEKAKLDEKVIELNETVVKANKALEEANAQIKTLTEELNALKTEKEQAELERKKAEVNSYFKTEIPKNGFTEEEINLLKPFVEKVDLEGLKNAESELCAKKFKEMVRSKDNKENEDTEINSQFTSFIPIHEKDIKDFENSKVSFFN